MNCGQRSDAILGTAILADFHLSSFILSYILCVYGKKDPNMTKTLFRHGNSLALVIDKPILELLDISADTPLEVTTNGDSLLISPVRDKSRQKKLRSSLDKINRKFADDLRRLAE
jgi:antitoxin component of MazEF toxin-antitoxin module